MWAKIIQINKRDVFFIGGTENHYIASARNFHLCLITKRLTEKARMRKARYAFGVCNMNHHLYAIGGCVQNNQSTRSCERYDIINDRWEELPKLRLKRYAVTVIPVERRYLYGFGGMDAQIDQDVRMEETVIILDTLQIAQGWQRITIRSHTTMSC